MSTTATHLNGAARAFPRETPRAPTTSAPRTNDSTEKESLRGSLLNKLVSVGRWMSLFRGAATTSQAVMNRREIDLAWLMLGATPVMPHQSPAPERCCRDY